MLKRKLISYVTGFHRISKSFVDKLLSVLSKYDHDEDRRLIFECIGLIVTKARMEQRFNAKRKQRFKVTSQRKFCYYIN